MNINKYLVSMDLKMIREINDISQMRLAELLNVSMSTVERWEKDKMKMSTSNMEEFYSYAYKNTIDINAIKEQLYKEDYTNEKQMVLFHGAKNEINGELDLNQSKNNNDFGKGFYCGETLEQSALFVSTFSDASIYIVKFNKANLNSVKFQVDLDWMLTIAYFRGRIDQYKDTKKMKGLLNKLDSIDYIIAPIADNRMFQIIDSFINEEITDEQCKHFLAATNLGFQYVFKTEKAIKNIEILERCYLCKDEKEMYLKRRMEDNKVSEDKIKVARKKYRGKGRYIDEIFL